MFSFSIFPGANRPKSETQKKWWGTEKTLDVENRPLTEPQDHNVLQEAD
jgi:hypothetical protein